MSMFPMKCPQCQQKTLVEGPVGTIPFVLCHECGRVLHRDMGGAQNFPPINFGWRGDGHYPTQEDSDIAKFQFTNLK